MKFDLSYFMCVIGMVFIIEAVPYMLFPKGLKLAARHIDKIPEIWIQIAGLVCALSGLAIIYLGRNLG
jgi:uncharacterized protein YjeT (DUF2065 family)